MAAIDAVLQIRTGSSRDLVEVLLEAGSAAVVQHPADEPTEPVATTAQRRLYFPIRTPKRAGEYHLRCNIYYKQVLVQSRLVTARVTRQIKPVTDAIISRLEYSLNRTLDPNRLSAIPRHTLSVMLNDKGEDGSHQFRFFGERDFKQDANFGATELNNLVELAREAMRRVAWGSGHEWDPDNPRHRFYYACEANEIDDKRFHKDLITLARAGYRFYDDIINRLAGGRRFLKELTEVMTPPGVVQFANRRSPRELIPAAIIYDYPLATQAKSTICPAFLQSLNSPDSLEQSACCNGSCPSRDDVAVVCPSGFWGFRHEIGFPVSFEPATNGLEDPDAPTDLGCAGSPSMAAALSIDNKFIMHDLHLGKLGATADGLILTPHRSRQETLNMLKAGGCHIVYFYCHGAEVHGTPCLQVGPTTAMGITNTDLRSSNVDWTELPALVFINGCRTTALTPLRDLTW